MLDTDTTTREVLTMYAVWFVFILAVVIILMKRRSK
jgi:hypothetical protein